MSLVLLKKSSEKQHGNRRDSETLGVWDLHLAQIFPRYMTLNNALDFSGPQETESDCQRTKSVKVIFKVLSECILLCLIKNYKKTLKIMEIGMKS